MMQYEERTSLQAAVWLAFVSCMGCAALAFTDEPVFAVGATAAAVCAAGYALDAEARRIMRETTWLAPSD